MQHSEKFMNNLKGMLDETSIRELPWRRGYRVMSEFLPKEVREGLENARKQSLKKRSRLRVKVGGHDFTILRYWDEGFSLDIEDAPHLRGLVDVYDGARHVSQCLIVASEEDGTEMVYEFKRETAAHDQVPLDYERDANAPIALIEKR